MLAVLAALAVWAFYGGLTLRRYEVQSEKLATGSVRIVVIADLHSHIWGNDQQPLLDMIAAQQPDIIALAGDVADDREPMYGAQLFLDSVTDIAPTYYVSGNHEYWSGAYDEIREMIGGYGITVLDNERVNINVNGVRLCLCGIDDPYVFEYTEDPELLEIGSVEKLLRQRFSDLDSGAYNILLAHRPELIETYLQYDFDVILSATRTAGRCASRCS
jgi:predicted MPP superfamily phosphohydrolase